MKQYVWLLEISRGVNLRRLVYIAHAPNVNEAIKIIQNDPSYVTLVNLPGGIRIKPTLLGIPLADSDWGNKYILI